MGNNVEKICLCCGRTFNAKESKYPFCSLIYKKRYSNHRGFSCDDCRTLPCEYRIEGSNITPDKCPNFKWDGSIKR